MSDEKRQCKAQWVQVMLIASRALGVAAESGAPLPRVPVLAELYQQGVELREGQLVMIAGPSGMGKSTLAQYIAGHDGRAGAGHLPGHGRE
jgi:ABC-type nitrate/sulfonate/bicarbonate transport system ATPase subunit